MKPPEPTIELLKTVPYFAGLNVTVLAMVADRCRSKWLREVSSSSWRETRVRPSIFLNRGV